MSWPSGCIRGVDLSANQDKLDIDKFVKANPDVKRYVLRAHNAFGRIDAKLEAFSRGVPEYDLYLWPDPIATLANVRAKWMGFTGMRPKTVWLDCEWSAATWKQMTGKAPLRSITEDTRESLRILTDLFPKVGVYTRGVTWWDENIRKHGWEKDYSFWLARYPMKWRDANGDWRQALNHAEIEALLPNVDLWIGEHIPPENVVGWQCGDHARLPTYSKDIDIDLWIPQEPPRPPLEEIVADHEKRIGALEAT